MSDPARSAYSKARAILSARSNSSTLERARDPTKRVSCTLRRHRRLYLGLCRLCLRVLIPKNVLHLCIQLIRSLINEFEVASFDLSPRPFAQVLGEHGFDESGARLLRSCNAINPGEHLFRQCDRSLLFHTTIIPLARTSVLAR